MSRDIALFILRGGILLGNNPINFVSVTESSGIALLQQITI